MSVNWNWNNKMGEIILKQKHIDGKVYTYKNNMYCANCLCAVIYDFKEKEMVDGVEKMVDKYQFITFWSDVKHLRRCLGLEKNYEYNIYKQEDNWFAKVRINTYYFKSKEVVQMAKSFVESGIKVELYYKDMTDVYAKEKKVSIKRG